MIDLLSLSDWQMTYGERAALEGVLTQAKPQLSIEIGTAEGGSLRRIAANSGEVHSFDLVEPAPSIREMATVILHTGDSHALLPEFLAELEREGRNVDFALVDGDHTADGVRRDMEALLSSSAVGRCLILIHDTANDIVRDGLEQVDYHGHPKVMHVDLDFIAGHLSARGAFHHQLWGGLGLVVVDNRSEAERFAGPQNGEFYPSFELFAAMRDGLVDLQRAGEMASPREVVSGGASERTLQLADDLERTRASLTAIKQSPSWRMTAPLRELKRIVRARLDG